MKDQYSLYIAIAALIFVAFRLYQKYNSKQSGKTNVESKTKGAFHSSEKDDDYEPYAKK